MGTRIDEAYRLALKHCYYPPRDIAGLHAAVREAGGHGRWNREGNLHFFEALSYGASLVWDEMTGGLRVVLLGDHVRGLDPDDAMVECERCEPGELTSKNSLAPIQYDCMDCEIIRTCSNWFGFDLSIEGEKSAIMERLSRLTRLFDKYGNYSVVHGFDPDRTYHGFQILDRNEAPPGGAGWFVVDYQIDVTVPLRISLDRYFDADWEPASEKNLTCALQSLERECGKLGIDLQSSNGRRAYFRDGPRIVGYDERCEMHSEDRVALEA